MPELKQARKIILDADGVFLSERPYWEVALITAFRRCGLQAPQPTVLELAFEEIELQRVTKSRGCNSNWDLTAVLDRALQQPSVRDDVARLLDAGRVPEALGRLELASAALVRCDQGNADPLLDFGIDRKAGNFRDVVDAFQQVLAGIEAPHRPREPVEILRRCFAGWQERGFELAICTGRHRAEIEAPLAWLGLDEFFDPISITSGDEVDRAEASTGRSGLGKPHRFPVLCAAIGYEPALASLGGQALQVSDVESIYVGDGWSDFLAVEQARDAGLPLRYVHVRSGVTSSAQEATIGASERTLSIVDSLTEVVA